MDGWMVGHKNSVLLLVCVCVNLSSKPLSSLSLLNLSFSLTDPPPTNGPSDRPRRIGGSLKKETRHVSISNAAQLPTYLQIYLTLT